MGVQEAHPLVAGHVIINKLSDWRIHIPFYPQKLALTVEVLRQLASVPTDCTLRWGMHPASSSVHPLLRTLMWTAVLSVESNLTDAAPWNTMFTF
jgi:hypothetical protein